jgi:hypothetical protein
MKPSVIFGAVALSSLLGCSANSGDEGSNGKGSNSGSGATSNTGATGTGGPDLGSGGVPVLVDPNAMAGTGGGAPVKNGECAQENFMVNSKPADILLVLDRSKSMIEHPVPGAATRWAAVVPALTSVIQATDSAVSWGLKLFPEGEGSECSALSDAIPAQIMPGNAATVTGVINSTMALGNGTPTGDAILKATAYLKSRNVANQFILLATDGDPSCPSGGDAALKYATDAISAAKAAGFPTYVIGVLDPVENKSSLPRLNAMAEAGGTSRSDNPIADKFYQAQSQEELTNALKAVTGQVVSCVFDFKAPPPDPTNIAVKVNGEWIMQDKTKTQGWDYTSAQSMGLELHGDACQQVKDASANKVDIIFGCKGEPIVIPK